MKFSLSDLCIKLTLVKDGKNLCGHNMSTKITVQGEDLFIPKEGMDTSLFFALVPVLAAKQRLTDKFDWMSSDSEIQCPVYGCGVQASIQRTETSLFLRSKVTAKPFQKGNCHDFQ